MRRAAPIAGVVALVLAACGGGRTSPREPIEQRAPTVDAGVDAGPDVALLTEIADGLAETLATMATITTDAADCKTMARELDRLFDQAATVFALAQAQASAPSAARLLATAMDARAEEVTPLVERIGRGLARCQQDPDVAAAMARMPTF